VRLAERNLGAERATLRSRIKTIEARLPIPAGGRAGRAQGYATPAGRYGKQVRLQVLKARLHRVDQQLSAGRVPVVRGGKRLLGTRRRLAEAGLTEARWRERWDVVGPAAGRHRGGRRRQHRHD